MLKITIIIAVYNGAKTLERCLRSCFEQTYAEKEVILIDGNSTDSTLDIVKQYAPQLAFWVSEPDTGIYNAWNKALKQASGEWVCFLGCDDWWISPTSLERLAQETRHPEVNFISGQLYLVDQEGRILNSVGKRLDCCHPLQGMRIAHSGALHHQSLFATYGLFDETYKIAGDFEFLLRACASIREVFIDEHFIYMSNGGVSNTQTVTTINEGYRALRWHRRSEPILAWQFLTLFYAANIKILVKKFWSSPFPPPQKLS
jgi:glycosyltransferase involved in cell wall biosynthesis